MPRGGKRAEFPRCFPENVDLNFLGFRNPVFSIDTIWNSILEGCLFLLFRSTLVVKIKKTQESTPIILTEIRLLPFDSPLSFTPHEFFSCVLSVYCLRSPSRIQYRTELIPRAPKGRRTRHPPLFSLAFAVIIE